MKTLCLLIIFCVLYSLSSQQEYRSYSGASNNAANPTWGAEGNTYKPLGKYSLRYLDGVSAIGDQYEARAKIKTMFSWNAPLIPDSSGVNDFFVQYAQLPYTDLGRRALGLCPGIAQCFSSVSDVVPYNMTCDPLFDAYCIGNVTMSFRRNVYRNGTGVGNIPREVIHAGTAWLDADFLYGTDPASTARRRVNSTMLAANPGLKGQIKDLDQDLTYSVFSVPPTWVPYQIWAWEHNRMASYLNQTNPSWDDERVFQTARKWTTALWQKTTTREYLAAATGRPIKSYTGYNASVEPKLDPFILHGLGRHGHHSTADFVMLLDENFNLATRGIVQMNEFWTGWRATGVRYINYFKEYIRGMIASISWDPSSFMVPNAAIKFNTNDLMLADVLRLRDVGAPLYNDLRKGFGYEPIKDFAELTPSIRVQNILRTLTGNDVEKLEAKWGVFAEKRVEGAHLGKLAGDLLHLQYENVRDGDRFWYENGQFTEQELTQIYSTSLTDIVQRALVFKFGTDLGPKIPPNLFFVPTRQNPTAPAAVMYPDSDFYENHLDLATNYKLSWTVDRTRQQVNFRLQVQTNGWMGIGWDAFNGTMKNADIYICVVKDTSVEVRDSFAFDVGVPTLDSTLSGGKNDATNVTGYRKDGVAVCKFSRKIDTGDANYDRTLRNEDQKLIFAYNSLTTDLIYHGPARSSAVRLNFLKVAPTTAAPTTAPAPTCPQSSASSLFSSFFFLAVFVLIGFLF